MVALGGCTGEEPVEDPVDDAVSGPSSTPPAPKAESPDVGLVVRALAREQALVELLTETGRRHRSLRRRLAPTLRVHIDHVELLRGAADLSGDPVPPPDPVVGGPPRAMLARTARAERALVGQHTTAAVAARSGAFARVLAGMAAAAAQQAVLLDGIAPSGPSPAAGPEVAP